jgi:hypothetical protein
MTIHISGQHITKVSIPVSWFRTIRMRPNNPAQYSAPDSIPDRKHKSEGDAQ